VGLSEIRRTKRNRCKSGIVCMREELKSKSNKVKLEEEKFNFPRNQIEVENIQIRKLKRKKIERKSRVPGCA
jgi:hypothetical protein